MHLTAEQQKDLYRKLEELTEKSDWLFVMTDDADGVVMSNQGRTRAKLLVYQAMVFIESGPAQ